MLQKGQKRVAQPHVEQKCGTNDKQVLAGKISGDTKNGAEVGTNIDATDSCSSFTQSNILSRAISVILSRIIIQKDFKQLRFKVNA